MKRLLVYSKDYCGQITIASISSVTASIATVFIIDILTFIISIILGEWVSYKLMIRKSESTTLSKTLSLAIIFYFLISFILFTYNPPNINLFKDPTQIMNRLYM